MFFTNQSLIDAFTNYLNVVVARYANTSTLFSWEVANDPRCNSTLPSAPTCQSTDVTSWVSIISKTVKALDPNHLVASGAGGFMCVGCKKLFATPAPAPSPSAAARRRRSPGLLTPAKVMAKRAELLKKWRSERAAPSGGKTIRGRWSAPDARRQMEPATQQTGFNGAQGVDTEDINAIPEVDFASFQLFPDQNMYMAVDSADTDPVTQAIDSGTAWIASNADAAATAGKPSALTAFGLVSLNSSSHFVPFNQSSVTVADVLNSAVKTIGANQTQQAMAYSSWIQTAITHGVSSIGQYQWGQSFQSSTSPLITTSPLTTPGNVSQLSPDDGYADYDNSQKAIFSQAAQQQTAMNG
jgi:mannan endo-1,4-beta-mannosidase